MADRVWLMGVSRLVRVKENAAGGFTIQRLVKREHAKGAFDPEPTQPDMVWAGYALAPQYHECIQPMIDLQAQLVAAARQRQQAARRPA